MFPILMSSPVEHDSKHGSALLGSHDRVSHRLEPTQSFSPYRLGLPTNTAVDKRRIDPLLNRTSTLSMLIRHYLERAENVKKREDKWNICPLRDLSDCKRITERICEKKTLKANV